MILAGISLGSTFKPINSLKLLLHSRGQNPKDSALASTRIDSLTQITWKAAM